MQWVPGWVQWRCVRPTGVKVQWVPGAVQWRCVRRRPEGDQDRARVQAGGGGRSSREKGQCNAYAPEPNKDGLVFERLRVSRQLQAAPQLCQNAADSCAAACFAGSQAAPAAHTRC